MIGLGFARASPSVTRMKVRMFQPTVHDDAIERVAAVLRSGWIGEGPVTREFEQRLATRLGNPRALAVNSGTSALHLALRLAGVGPGDEVITTAQTMLATSQAILAVGAEPVYADVQYGTGNLDPASVPRYLNDRTRAILAVDWGGYPCDWDELRDIANRHGLATIDDAAHALGASYHDVPVGAIADYTCFSFQAVKHLTTGDGGMLCVGRPEEYRRAMSLRWYGIDRERRRPSILGEPEWSVVELGYKYHMNDIAAAIGLGNLEGLDEQLLRRRELAGRYAGALDGVAGLTLFERRADRICANWLFSIHVERREAFCRMMLDRGVQVSVVHLRIDKHPICGGVRHDLTELGRFTETHVSLPVHPALTDEEIDYVVASVRGGW